MTDQQRNTARGNVTESSLVASAHILRLLVFFTPKSFLGPALFYATLYWWFVPTSMRLDIPISYPSTGWKIVASLCVIPAFFISRLSSEALASSLPQSWTTSLHRIIAPASFASNLVATVLAVRLFAPVVGFSALPPKAVALVFSCFVLFAWMDICKRSLGIFARIDSANRRLPELAGLSAPELLATDARPPILYLRSFEGERSKATTLGRFGYIRRRTAGFYLVSRRPRDEESFSAFLRRTLAREYKMKLLDSNRSVHDEQTLFAEYFSDFGPYIAIGRPGESFESMDVGAAKYYVPDEIWKTKVVELIASSAAIVIEAAESDGLSWEIREVIRRKRPESVLLILPRNDADYRDFRIFATGLFPHPMPNGIPRTRLIMFGSDWIPIPLEDYTMVLEDAVRPFVARLWSGPVHREATAHG